MKDPQEVLRPKEDELEKVQPIPRPKRALMKSAFAHTRQHASIQDATRFPLLSHQTA